MKTLWLHRTESSDHNGVQRALVSVLVTLGIRPHLLDLVVSSLQGPGHPNRTADLGRDCDTATSQPTLGLFLAESRTLHTERQDASVGHVPSRGELTRRHVPVLTFSGLVHIDSLVTLLRKRQIRLQVQLALGLILALEFFLGP